MMTIVYSPEMPLLMDALNSIAHGAVWLIVGWHLIAVVAGVAIMTWEHFTRPPGPTAEDIGLAADSYEARYGDAAFRQIGEEMYEERSANGSGQRYQFLREVSGELVKRLVARDRTGSVAAPKSSQISAFSGQTIHSPPHML
jgi:hypothetical protein